MGRKLNASTPTVINTELRPLTESFYVEASSQTAQWFYDNTSQYAPDRKLTPLVLSPFLSAFDPDTQQSYSTEVTDISDPEHLAFYTVQWLASEYNSTVAITYTYGISQYESTANNTTAPADISSWSSSPVAVTQQKPYAWVKKVSTATVEGLQRNITVYYKSDGNAIANISGGGYWEEEITNTVDGQNIDYRRDGNTLIVKKNVSYSHAVNIRCVATYIDPRDSGVTYTVEDVTMLTTNRDATVVLPEVAIVSPSSMSFNPLTDYDDNGNQQSVFSFEGVVTNNPDVEHVISEDLAQYKVDGWGTEEIEGASGSCSPTMTIRYPDGSIETDARFMYRKTADGTKLDVSGNAFITNIKGETIAWNQRFLYNASYNSNGVTTTITNNYLVSTGTTTKANTAYISTVNTSKTIAGHKYYLRCPRPQGVNILSGGVGVYSGTVTEDGDFIITESSSRTLYLQWYPTAANMTIDVKGYILFIDLTLIYGSGNEPTSVTTFKADYLKWFGKPLGFETYDTGSLKPVKMVSMKTVGFNVWDEEWENGLYNATTGAKQANANAIRSKNYIDVLPNTNYYIRELHIPIRIFFYDNNKLLLTSLSTEMDLSYGALPFTTPTNCRYITFHCGLEYGNTYKNDICISLAYNTSRRTQYQRHWHNTSMLNVTEIKGRVVTNGQATGNLVTIFPDGMLRARGRAVSDEIYTENGKIYAIKRVGRLNLGSLTTSYQTISGVKFFQCTIPNADCKANTTNLACPLYLSTTTSWESVANMYMKAHPSVANYIYIRNDAYTSAPTFKTAMSGVMLHYELATPVTYEIDEIQSPFIFKWFAMNNGVETAIDTLPCYVDGQNTPTLRVDAMFAEKLNVVLRATKGAGLEELSPSKAFASLEWRVPDIDTHVVSYNGGAVRTNTGDMTFGTIINVRGKMLEAIRRNTHLRMNWKYRYSSNTVVHDAGWGDMTPQDEEMKQSVTISNANLMHVKTTAGQTLASTHVYPEVYLLGAWKPATSTTVAYDKPTTTKDGVTYERTID